MKDWTIEELESRKVILRDLELERDVVMARVGMV